MFALVITGPRYNKALADTRLWVKTENSMLETATFELHLHNVIESFRVRTPPSLQLLQNIEGGVMRASRGRMVVVPSLPEVRRLAIHITLIGPIGHRFFAIIPVWSVIPCLT